MVEYGWDQTPTPDLGLDITKAPADIQKLYKWVIQKTHGEDVASAYAQGLVAAGIIAKNAEAMSLFTSGKMDELKVFVDDMLLEMTDKDVISAPEIIASRDGAPTLSDRLDRDFQLSNKLISDVYSRLDSGPYIPTEDELPRDGVDVSSQLNELLLKHRHINIPSGHYIINQVSVPSNTVLEFLPGAYIEGISNTNGQQKGCIMVSGERRNKVFYNDVINIGDTILNVDTTQYTVGDLIEISQFFDHTDPDYDRSTHEDKYVYYLGKVLSIDSSKGTITLDTPVYNRFIDSSTVSISIIDSAKNIVIKGNDTKFHMEGTLYDNHISTGLSDNVLIYGFEFDGGGGKGVSVNESINVVVRNCYRHSPDIRTAGHGYGFIFSKSAHCYGYNLLTSGCRHGVDVAWASYDIHVADSIDYGGGFNLHGQNSSQVIYNNCKCFGSRILGGAHFNVGNASYLSDKNITFSNCVSEGSLSEAFSVSSKSYNVTFDNVTAKDCRVGINVINGSHDIYSVGTNNIGYIYDGIRCFESYNIYLSDVNLVGITGSNSSMSIRNSTNVSVASLDMTCQGSIFGLYVGGSSKDVVVNKLRFRGKATSAIRTSDTSDNVTIGMLDILCDSPDRVININSPGNFSIDNIFYLAGSGVLYNIYGSVLYIGGGRISVPSLIKGKYRISNSTFLEGVDLGSDTKSIFVNNVVSSSKVNSIPSATSNNIIKYITD